MDALTEEISEKQETKTEDQMDVILYFLNSCGIVCTNINEINGIIIPREKLLNHEIYTLR